MNWTTVTYMVLRNTPIHHIINLEIFYSLKKVEILTEQWRREYNTIRPHSSLGIATNCSLGMIASDTGRQHRRQ
jgi:transposase InsO family protein